MTTSDWVRTFRGTATRALLACVVAALFVGLPGVEAQADDEVPPPPPPPTEDAPSPEAAGVEEAGAEKIVEGDETAAAAAAEQRRVPSAAGEPFDPSPPPRQSPCEIFEWCPPQRRAPTLDRCTVSGGYAEDQCDPCLTRRPSFRPVHGDLRFEWRWRTGGGNSDHVLWQFANIRFGDQEAPGWSGAFHGALIENLAPSDTAGFDPLFSIWDTYGDITGQLYHMYATYRPTRGPLRLARVGRMWIDAGEMIQLDGGLADFWPVGSRRTSDLGIKAYVGVPSYLFESDPAGDFAAGGEVSAKLWHNARARLQYVYIKNRNRAYGNVDNHLTTLTVDQCFRPGQNLQLRYQQLDDNPRFITARFSTYSVRNDLQITAWVNTLVTRQFEQVYDTDLYYGVLRDTEPYVEGYLAASKGIGERFSIEGVIAARRLYDSADARQFNREFERYGLTFSVYDWPSSRWTASVSGEWWEDTEDYGAATFDVEYKPSTCLRFRFGTDYSLYSRDVFTLEERVDSYGFYARVRYDFTKRLQGWLRFRVEDDTFDTYTLMRTGFTWEF